MHRFLKSQSHIYLTCRDVVIFHFLRVLKSSGGYLSSSQLTAHIYYTQSLWRFFFDFVLTFRKKYIRRGAFSKSTDCWLNDTILKSYYSTNTISKKSAPYVFVGWMIRFVKKSIFLEISIKSAPYVFKHTEMQNFLASTQIMRRVTLSNQLQVNSLLTSTTYYHCGALFWFFFRIFFLKNTH